MAKSKKLKSGVKAGIIVGGLVLGVLGIAGVAYAFSKKKKEGEDQPTEVVRELGGYPEEGIYVKYLPVSKKAFVDFTDANGNVLWESSMVDYDNEDNALKLQYFDALWKNVMDSSEQWKQFKDVNTVLNTILALRTPVYYANIPQSDWDDIDPAVVRQSFENIFGKYRPATPPPMDVTQGDTTTTQTNTNLTTDTGGPANVTGGPANVTGGPGGITTATGNVVNTLFGCGRTIG